MPVDFNIPRTMRHLYREGGERMDLALEFLEGAAKLNTPVDLGQLVGSYNRRRFRRGNVITGRLSNSAEHAPYVELGTGKHSTQPGARKTPWVYRDSRGRYFRTSGQRPQPFLRPALIHNRGQIKTILGAR